MFRFAMFGGISAITGFSLFSGGNNNVAFCKFVKPPFDVQRIGNDITKLLEDTPEMGPTLVRLAWHQAGTFDKSKTDGVSNTASMRFHPECAHGANAGLDKARAFLEPLKKKYPDMSYADLWNLAACVAIENMGGPHVEFRWGRKDAKAGKDCAPDGRLPDALGGAQHIRDIFGRMGFTDREMVALIGGGHAIGKCHADASGFVGPWKHDWLSFDNGFFSALLQEKWVLDKTKKQRQYTDKNTGMLMMLPADLAIAQDPKFLKIAKLYESDNDVFQRDFAKVFQTLLEFGQEKNLNEGPQYQPVEE